MKRWQKASIAVLAVVGLLATLGWVFRTDLILLAVSSRSQPDISPEPLAIRWDRGPDEADLPISERPPNIVLILADDLGINDISTFGGGLAGGLVKTPNIDRLAAQGVNFTQAYAGNATCSPSRAMLMTGRYPTRSGFEFTPTPNGMGRVLDLIMGDIRPDLPPTIYDAEASGARPEYAEQGLPPEEITIAELLAPLGYHSVHIGKWHMGQSQRVDAMAQGFDESLLMANGMYLPEDHPDVVNAKVEFDAIDRFLWAALKYSTSYNRSERFEPGGYLTDYWTNEAVKVIEANRNRPFFLYLAHWGVHNPLQATRADYEAVGDIKPHRLRVYAAMIRALDRSVEKIMAKLEDEGLADNTIVVFSSDNGGAGYIGLSEINAPYRGWKATLFEGGIRVPMFVRWPARIPAGGVFEAPVSHVDVMPTLASAADAALPAGVAIDGVDLLPLASGEGVLSRPDDAIYWQSGGYKSVRAGDWKLQLGVDGDTAWLYNLANDPTEQSNLADTRPDKLAELTALLNRHQAGAREPLYPSATQVSVPVDKSLAETYEEGDFFVYWPN